MFCPNCGNNIRDGEKKCYICGASINTDSFENSKKESEIYDYENFDVDIASQLQSDDAQYVNRVPHQAADANGTYVQTPAAVKNSGALAGNRNSDKNFTKVIVFLAIVLLIVVVAAAVVFFAARNGKNTVSENDKETSESVSYMIKSTSDSGSTSAAESENQQNRGTAYSAGDIITFGTYEQDNDSSDGKEDIEWIILEIDGDEALVISRYGLDAMAYNDSFTGVTWETCSLRSRLNGTFYSIAFSDEEKARIKTTTVYNTDNYEYNTDGGSNTQDKVFLLSIDEAEKYFSSDDDRTCTPTRYALANGASENTYEDLIEVGDTPEKASKYAGNCWWWLRSPGYQASNAAYIFASGETGTYGRNVDRNYVCIRPAMWISL